MGLTCGAVERGPHKGLKLHHVATILICLSIIVFSFFSFSIVVIDTNNKELFPPRQPWPSFQSPVPTIRWHVQQSSSVEISRPVKAVFRVEKALQGMGTLFRKGTRPMRELIVAHLSETTSVTSLRLFLRTLHRSGAAARADVVLLFPWSTVPAEMIKLIHEEESNFQRMSAMFDPKRSTSRRGSDISNSTLTPFNAMVFKRAAEEHRVRGDVMWGNSSSAQVGGIKQSWSGYGSIAGFEMQELDPHGVLSGFFDNPPAQLRRWVCYEMLLGMVRSKYRNVLLTQVKGVLFVGDALAAVRRHQTLYLSAEDRSWLDLDAEAYLEWQEPLNPVERVSLVKEQKDEKAAEKIVNSYRSIEVKSVHRSILQHQDEEEDASSETKEVEEQDDNPPKRKSKGPVLQKKGFIEERVKGLIPSVYGRSLWQSLDKGQKEKAVLNSGFLMGKTDYVRKLANKMTTETVRIALEKKNRQPFHDKAILNYLVHQSSVLGKRILEHVKIVPNRDSVVHSLQGSKQPHVFWKRRSRGSRYAVIQGFNNTRSVSDVERGHRIVAALYNDICQSPADSRVYRDCLNRSSSFDTS